MNSLQFDWTVSVGNIFTAVGFIIGCLLFANRVRNDVTNVSKGLVALEERLDEKVTDIKGEVKDIKGTMKEFASALVQIARQDERMNFMERRIAELSTRQYEEKTS